MRKITLLIATVVAALAGLALVLAPTASATPASSFLVQGSTLTFASPDPLHNSIVSPNGRYQAYLAYHALIVERVTNHQTLAVFGPTSEVEDAGEFLTLQTDGNLVLYSGSGQALWQTGTYVGRPGGALVMQDDGNLVLYSTPDAQLKQVALWASNTVQVDYKTLPTR